MSNKGKFILLHPMTELAESVAESFAGVVDIKVVALTEGPAIIHNQEDVALAGPDSIRKARKAEKEGCKAICLTCHGDPNLGSIREAVRIPVIGPMELAMHFCAMLAHRFSILVLSGISPRNKQDSSLRSRMTSYAVSP